MMSFERRLLGISLLGMLFFGTIDALRSIATPMIQTDLQLNYWQISLAFTAGSVGYLTGSFAGGLVVDRTGLKTATLVGAAASGAGIFIYLMFKSPLPFIAGFVIAGFGNGVFEIGLNGAVPAVVASAKDRTRYFNWLHGFYGLGATGLPLIGARALSTGEWRSGYWAELAFLGSIAAMAALLRYGKLTPGGQESVPTSGTLSRSRSRLPMSYLLISLLAAIGAYVMAEVGFSTWSPTYLVEVRGLSIAEASYYLSGFFLVFTAGRLTGHWWVNRIGQLKAVLLSVCAAIVSLGIAVFGSNSARRSSLRRESAFPPFSQRSRPSHARCTRRMRGWFWGIFLPLRASGACLPTR
ncbi:MFS transporter [Paenibacillus sp. P26]|nr:MFS transporter [Paenibacillus sp. P26]